MTEQEFKNLKVNDIIYDSSLFNDQGTILKFNNYAKNDLLINNFHLTQLEANIVYIKNELLWLENAILDEWKRMRRIKEFKNRYKDFMKEHCEYFI